MSNRASTIASQLTPGGNVRNFEIVGNGAVFTLDVPPLNILGKKNRAEILAAVNEAAHNPAVKFLVITGKGKAFCAGADVTELRSIHSTDAQNFNLSPLGPALIDQIEAVEKPVIAAVNGLALGGGCELALGCHFRVASKKAMFGLPEIKLGLIPGFGGTQRLSRCIGIQGAIQMCCTGSNVKSATALKMGLADKLGDNAVAEALAFGEHIVANKVPIRRLCNDASKLGHSTNSIILAQARKKIAKSIPKGVIAPLVALDAIEAAANAPNFSAGLKAERGLFLKVAVSPQAKAMQHFFFSERLATKIPGLPKTETRPIRSVGIIGGGTMGGGIAMNFLNIGVPVVLIETAEDRKKFCIETIAKNYESRVAKGKMTNGQFKRIMSLLSVVVNDYAALRDVDYVIEAVFESMQLKKEIFAKLDKSCKPSCILATNTSTLSIDEIANVTSRPQKVIGAHFFSPANIMKLLEFVRGKDTDAETITQSMMLGKMIRKAPMLAGNCFGFISNRMLLSALFQVQCMMEEGALPLELDKAIIEFGFPIGPNAMNDLAGLDVTWRIRGETPAHLRRKRDTSQVMEQLIKLNRFGQKTRKGYYRYDPANPRKALPDPEVDKIIINVSKQKGIKRRNLSTKEIEERYIFALVNEAAYILQEGFAIRPSDIDIVYIYGFSFPPYKGGPCHYADHLGLPNVVEGIKKYNAAFGADTFPPPCPLLLDLVAKGATFGSLNK